jgi:ATP-dependent RNA helicase RhlE
MPDVRRVVAKLPKKRQTACFSATMPDAIARLADSLLCDPVQIRIAPIKATTELIEQSVFFVQRQNKPQLLANLLKTGAISRALVFTRTKHGADRVVRQLHQSGIRADAIHGNKSQSARQRTLADFKLNRTPVLVATDIASRGIDVEGISHVLNYDLPDEPETYIHRIGRTGRAGASGVALSFCDNEERKYLKAIERLIRQTLRVEESHLGAPMSIQPSRSQGQAKDSQMAGRTLRKHTVGSSGVAKTAGRPRASQAAGSSRKRKAWTFVSR